MAFRRPSIGIRRRKAIGLLEDVRLSADSYEGLKLPFRIGRVKAESSFESVEIFKPARAW